MKVYGLIGYPLSHSFSKGFFAEKFAREGIKECMYDSFPIPTIGDLPALLTQQPGLQGLNVTIPYKEVVIPYLDELSPAAAKMKAVNCIRFKDGRKIGYNTDAIGFRRSLEPLLQPHHNKALILGTGGAAKAVQYVLESLNIPYQLVSRQASAATISYEQLDAATMASHTLIVNTTPLGMYPNLEAAPAIPYELLTADHLLYDLIYNPAVTAFLQKGADKGATIKNGHEMLILQAEASWEIWNEQ
ncbi:shikimate dehydrogenase family protein [Chitinophaga pinensis]|uniref:Shikimate dehydrogenase substrate binding domain protein n=1 Tax=Chitinophaga pinensis (strain ATCC 43595 / DSM 2588 / LMG 13176 / NBRC 15968 / NCIMB 11800 / UQM 2034) TaxID=485918 RepID=A0A979GN31_CHIPD|nr:shikimate dehydrogenase [Chitinophaga pinensis]ACU59167.1 Shikimate dehydrogenase substrate binding domain protein [Chitinophaga pinensis DSM 2588]